MGVDDCADLTGPSPRLVFVDPIDKAYTLEVSSPASTVRGGPPGLRAVLRVTSAVELNVSVNAAGVRAAAGLKGDVVRMSVEARMSSSLSASARRSWF
jgi:hypothetical protein